MSREDVSRRLNDRLARLATESKARAIAVALGEKRNFVALNRGGAGKITLRTSEESTRKPMRIGHKRYQVARMNGWYEVDFRGIGSKRRRVFNLYELVQVSAVRKTTSSAVRKRKDAKKRCAKS